MDNKENQSGGGEISSSGARKINVSYKDAEQEFNKVDRTLEDIVNEELDEDETRSDMDEIFEEPVEAPKERIERVEPKTIKKEDSYEREDESEWEANEASVKEIRDSEGLDRKPIKAGKKSGKGAIIFLLVLMILLVAGFAVYYMLSMQIIKNDIFVGNTTKCETPVGPAEKKETPEIKDEEEVIGIVENIRDKLIEKNSVMFGGMVMTYNDYRVGYEMDDGLLGVLDKSYGLFRPPYTIDDAVSEEVVVMVLKELGFSEYGTGAGSLGAEEYINEDLSIVCESGNYAPFRLGCASVNWYSEDDKELSINLAEAFEKKEGIRPPIMIGKVSNIKKTDDSKYESIVASSGFAASFFYKKTEDSDWIYVTSTQDRPDCAHFDEDARAAFKGNGMCADYSADPDGNIIVEF